MITNESILEVTTADNDKLYLFPSRGGGVIDNAVSILTQAVSKTGGSFLKLHVGKTRDTDIRYINIAYIKEYKPVSSTVPPSIVSLFTVPEKETDEDRKERTRKLNTYFEI